MLDTLRLLASAALGSMVAAGVALGAAGCGPDAPGSRPARDVTAVATPPPAVVAAESPVATPSPVAPGAPTVDVAPTEAPADAPAAPAEAAKAAPEPPPIPPSTAVLHVGDSMVPMLARALRPRFKALGVRYEMRFEKSTFTSTWAGRMDGLVSATQPHLVIVTLGGNELANPRPETHARFVRRIVSAIGGRPCVWTTPPLWRGESGIVDVIQKNAAPCRFFETDRFLTAPIERAGDDIHPTAEGGVAWADVLWPWLMAERVGGEQPWALRPGPADEYAPRGPRGAPTFAEGARR